MSVRSRSRVAVTAGLSRAKPRIAYVEPAADSAPTTRELRRFVHDRLPACMTPDFEMITQLPLTVNAKIDRSRLQSAQYQKPSTPPSFPITEINPEVSPQPAKNQTPEREEPIQAAAKTITRTERAVARIWEDCLQVKTVMASDNFFELGGDSLLVIRLVNQIELELDVTVTLREVFGCDTLIELSALCFARHIERLVADNGETKRIAIESVLTEIEALSESKAFAELGALQSQA